MKIKSQNSTSHIGEILTSDPDSLLIYTTVRGALWAESKTQEEEIPRHLNWKSLILTYEMNAPNLQNELFNKSCLEFCLPKEKAPTVIRKL